MGKAGSKFSPPTKYVAGFIFILMLTLNMCVGLLLGVVLVLMGFLCVFSKDLNDYHACFDLLPTIQGIPCDLLTGEDRQWAISPDEPANHIAATVEMCSTRRPCMYLCLGSINKKIL